MEQVSQLQSDKAVLEGQIPESAHAQAGERPVERIQVMLPLLGRDSPCDDLWPGLAIEREFTITVAKDE